PGRGGPIRRWSLVSSLAISGDQSMPTVLVHNAYGKSRVRLTKVQRHADRHDLFEWSVDVQLTGDFAAAYTAGDNRQVIATDTMKNVVYALAADHALRSPEAFAFAVGRH